MSKEPGLPLFSGCGMDSWRTETKKVKVRVAAPGNGDLWSNDADGNENVKETIGLIKKTTLHVRHAFLYISLPVFARLLRENTWFRVLWTT